MFYSLCVVSVKVVGSRTFQEMRLNKQSYCNEPTANNLPHELGLLLRSRHHHMGDKITFQDLMGGMNWSLWENSFMVASGASEKTACSV